MKRFLEKFAEALRQFLRVLGMSVESFGAALFPMVASSTLIAEIMAKVLTELLGSKLSSEAEEDFATRARVAGTHLEEAGQILDGLHDDLTRRKAELDGIVSNIEARQAEAVHWELIASINHDEGSALTREIEQRMQGRIREELERNKWGKRVIALVL